MVSLIIDRDLREVDQTLYNKHCQLRFKGLCSSCCDFFKTNKKSVRGHILHNKAVLNFPEKCCTESKSQTDCNELYAVLSNA